MAAGLPATIYRPSIVVGDSHTGETQKFDGPYFVMQWLLRQPTVAVLPKFAVLPSGRRPNRDAHQRRAA
jgi:thioester reductase-like protein